MKTTFFALAVAQLAAAHTTVFSVAINGKDQGLGNKDGGYIDSPPNNNPITDVTSKDMTCNVASIKASKSVDAVGGDEVTFQWHHNSNDASDDIIDPSHKGPIMVYISKAGSALSWTKLVEDGYDGKQWAVEKLIAGTYTGTPGQHSVTLPKLAPGEYVLRPEIIGLHEGNRVSGAQFYMECVHVKVGGSGTATLPAGVSIPGAYKAEDAGIHFDIYSGSISEYPIPGPKVWDGASSGADAPAAKAATPQVATPSKVAAAAAPASTKAAAPASTKAAAPASTQAAASAAPAAPTKAAPTSTKAAASAAPAKSTLATVAKPTPTSTSNSGSAKKYAQCGGSNYTGATACAEGSKCTEMNPYYSQCV